MLLLVTILLVAIGAISLVIGYAQSSLVPIYVSIGCSVVAAAVLLVFSRMTAKSQKADSADGGPSALDFDSAQPAPRSESAMTMAGTGGRGSSSSEAFAPEGQRSYGTDTQAEEWDGGDADDFPIDSYDSRRVGEILPLLAELDVDELDMVREREEGGKSRATVLARIDQLIEQLEADDRYEAENRNGDDDGGAESFKAATEPVLPAGGAVPGVDDGYFPIEDYDDLRASEILPLLPELDDDELEMVNEREVAGSARASILHKIEELLETSAATPATVPVAVFEPEPEPETVETSEIRPDSTAKRARATKPASRRSSKASTAKSSTSKAAPGPRATRTAAKVAKAPTSGGRAPTKAAKSPGRAVKAPAKAVKATAVASRPAPVKKTPSGKRTMVAAKVPAAKATPAKRAQKGPAGPSSTPAAKSTKRAAKR